LHTFAPNFRIYLWDCYGFQKTLRFNHQEKNMKRTAVWLLTISLLCASVITSASRATAKTSQGAEALFAMMPDSDGVISINVAQITRQINVLLAGKPEVAAQLQAQLDQLVAESGVDLRSIDHVVVGFTLGDGLKTEPLILATGNFNQERILTSLAGPLGRKWKARTYNGQKVWAEPVKKNAKTAKKDNNPGAIAFFDNQTLGVGSFESVKRSIDARAGARTAVSQNANLMSALHQSNASASIRFAFAIPEAARQKLIEATGAGALLKPLAAVNQIVGAIDLNDAGLLANISLVTGSEQEAGEVVNLINMGMSFIRLALASSTEAGGLVKILDGVSYSQSGAAANITLNISADLIKGLLDQLKSKTPKV
jgi:hypothetical protein